MQVVTLGPPLPYPYLEPCPLRTRRLDGFAGQGTAGGRCRAERWCRLISTPGLGSKASP